MIQRERGQYVVNFGLFDAVYEHETLPYSAEDLDRLQNGESPEEEIPLEQENNNNNSPSNKDNNSNGGVGTGNDKKHLNVSKCDEVFASCLKNYDNNNSYKKCRSRTRSKLNLNYSSLVKSHRGRPSSSSSEENNT